MDNKVADAVLLSKSLEENMSTSLTEAQRGSVAVTSAYNDQNVKEMIEFLNGVGIKMNSITSLRFLLLPKAFLSEFFAQRPVNDDDQEKIYREAQSLYHKLTKELDTPTLGGRI